MQVLLNGRLMDAAQATIAADDRGFTLGDGLFETIKVSSGRPLRWDAHWHRLTAGAAQLRLDLPFDRATLEESIPRLLDANGLSCAALRLTVTRGSGPRGLLPPLSAAATVLLSAGTVPSAAPPVRAVVTTSVRRNPLSPLARCKTISYLDNVLARMEAAERGADEAIFLNIWDRVAETTIANLFVVRRDGMILTPPVDEGALPGVRRAELIGRLGAVEQPLSLDEVLTADEVFLTNALSIRPLATLDGHRIGGDCPGPLTSELMAALEQE